MVSQSVRPKQVVEAPISSGVKNDDFQSAVSYLGNTTNTPSKTEANSPQKNDVAIQRVLDRYYLQALARELLPDHRIDICGRYLSFNKDHVKIVYRKERKIASFQNLAHCHSLWICSPCASVITEKRRDELKTAFENWHGKVMLVTFTMRHKQKQPLKKTLDILLSAYDRFLSGRYGDEKRDFYKIIGAVKALEVTYGENGWHPHLHVLYFGEFTLDQMRGLEHQFKKRWVELVKSFGGTANYANGLNVKDDEHFLREYIAKHGHEPTRELWSLESEVSKANVKSGRGDDHYTPFQLLRLYGDGWIEAGELFKEYEKAFFRKRQLVWSRGLKERLGVKDVSDKEILDAENENPYEVLAILSGHEWRRVRERNLQASLIIVASDGDVAKLEAFLKKHYIREG